MYKLSRFAFLLMASALLSFGRFAFGATATTPQITQTAARACDFSESVGVNTHFSYTDTPYYKQPAQVIRAIQDLRVHHVRDGLAYYWVAPNLYSIYQQLSAAGIHANLVVPNPATAGPDASSMAQLVPNYPSVESLEAPNEYDQSGNGNWAADLRNYLPVVWRTGQQSGVPVVGPSLTQEASYGKLGDASAYMDFGNLHVYWGGRNPETGGWGGPDAQMHYYGSLPYSFDFLNIDSPGRDAVITETGYVVNNRPKPNVIPEWVEAVYEPRLLLHAWNLGVKRTYIYELMDDPSSAQGFGLLRADLSARPAYTAIANLMRLLVDAPSDFAPEALTYSMIGNTSGVETTLLEKQNGSFFLALWQRRSIFDVNAVKETPLAPQQITLAFTGGRQVRKLWTFQNDGTVSETVLNKASLTIAVGGSVTMVKIQ